MSADIKNEASGDRMALLDRSGKPLELIAHVMRRTLIWERPEAIPQGDFLHETVRLITGRFPEDIRLEDMARHAGLNKFHFLRRFRRETGMTPAAFVQRMRVVRAMELLRETRLPVREVAGEVGYGNPAAFTRAFTRVMGVGPLQYRQKKAH